MGPEQLQLLLDRGRSEPEARPQDHHSFPRCLGHAREVQVQHERCCISSGCQEGRGRNEGQRLLPVGDYKLQPIRGSSPDGFKTFLFQFTRLKANSLSRKLTIDFLKSGLSWM